MKKKFCEIVKPGFYLKTGLYETRAYYLTGKTKGNLWIKVDVMKPEWCGLMPSAVTEDCVSGSFYGDVNPTEYAIPKKYKKQILLMKINKIIGQ